MTVIGEPPHIALVGFDVLVRLPMTSQVTGSGVLLAL